MNQNIIKIKKKAGKYKRITISKISELISFTIDFIIASKSYPKKSNNLSEIYIAISTTKGYADKTIPILIKNLHDIGIDKELVHVFEGGYSEKSSTVINGYHHHKVDNNSFDITALIGIIETGIVKNYWLLLHDTVLLKPSFKNIFNKLDPVGYDCLPLRKSPSMNIGVYSGDYLSRNRDYLLDFKNCNYTEEGLLSSKEKAFNEEDYLFNATKLKKQINQRLAKFEYTKFVKYFEKMRILEGYPQLGLIKYKANGSMLVLKDFLKPGSSPSDKFQDERDSWVIKL